MTRRNRNSKFKTHTQFKHLRFVDVEEGAILNNGGYTLAYRALQTVSEVPGKSTIEVQYAYSECQITENFNKNLGRNMAYHRLQNQAADFYDSFDVTDQLPEGYMQLLISLGDSFVDFKQTDFDLQTAVVTHFLQNAAEYLNLGTTEEGPGNLLENLIQHNGTAAINAAVLDYTPPTMESLMGEVASTITSIADTAIDQLDNLNLEDPPRSNMQTIADVRKALADIKDLVSSMHEDDDDEEEGEEDESDMDEEESDDEESDEDDEDDIDDEEGDEDESDDEEEEEDELDDDEDDGIEEEGR